MADPPTTIFTLGAALDKIIAIIAAFDRGRSIIIDSLNASQKAFVDFVVSQQNYNSTVTSKIGELAAKIDSLDARFSDRLDRLEGGVADLNASLTAQLTGLSARVGSLETADSNLADLVQVVLQALQGVATSDRQDQELDFLNTIIQDLQPTRATSIGLDLSHVTTEPQPRPSRPGP